MADISSTSIQKYSTLVRLNPDDPEAHFGLAMAFEEIDQPSEAFKEYETVLRLNPRHARAHLHLGFAYIRGNETVSAIKEWQKAYEINSDLYKIFEDPAHKAYYVRKIEEAISTFERPTLIRPDDSWSHYQLAMAYRYFNKKEMALAHIKKALDQNPNLWEAYNSAGEIYADLGQFQFAKIHFQKAIDVNPKFSDTFYNLGSILEEEGMVGIAIQKYERALESDSDNPKLLFALGRAYLKQGQYKKAISRLQKSIDFSSSNPHPHFLLAKACEALFKPEYAINEYEKAIEIEPKYAEAHYNLGLIYMQLGSPDRAVVHLENSLKLNPADSYAHYNLGNAYEKTGNYDKAINHYYNAVSLNPRDAFARYNLGQAYLKTGHYEEAIKEFKKTLEINPNDVSIFFSLGNAYMKQGDYANAIDMFQKTIDSKPNDFDSHHALACAFMADEKFDIAVLQLKRAIEIKPESPEPHYEMGHCFYRMDETDYAFESFQKAIKLDERHFKAKYSIGLIYSYNRNKPEISIDFFDQALEINPEFLPAIIEKGYALLKLKKYGESLKEFEKAANINPDNIDLLIGLAEVNGEIGKFEEARSYFQKALADDPENSRARFKFARLLAKYDEINSSIEQYEKALGLDPEMTDAYFELTDLFLKLGNEAEAKAVLSHLLDIDPYNVKGQNALDALFELSGQELVGKSVKDLIGEEEEEKVEEFVMPEESDSFEEKRRLRESEDGLIKPKERLAKKKPLIVKKALRNQREREAKSQEIPLIEPAVLSLFARAATTLSHGKSEESLGMFREIIEKSPEYYQAYLYLADLLAKSESDSEIKPILEKGLAIAAKFRDDEYIEIFKLRLGQLKTSEKAPDTSLLAEAEEERISTQEDWLPEAPSEEIAGIEKSEEPAESPKAAATEILQKIPEKETQIIEITEEKPESIPDIQETLEIIGDFIELGKYDRAISHIEKLRAKSPNIPEIYKYLSRINRQEGDWESYVSNWEKYIEISGDRTNDNLVLLMEGLEKSGQAARNIDILMEMSKKDPQDEALLEKIVALLLQHERFGDAIPFLQNLIKLKPKDPRYIFHLARAYRNTGKFSLSTVQYQKVLRLTEAPEIYNELGYTYEKIGKTKSAIKMYAKTLGIDQNNVTANLSLILLYEKCEDYANAFERINHTLNIKGLTEDRVKILEKKKIEVEKAIEIVGEAAPKSYRDDEDEEARVEEEDAGMESVEEESGESEEEENSTGDLEEESEQSELNQENGEKDKKSSRRKRKKKKKR